MLKKESIDKIAAALKIDAAALQTALTSQEEAEITIPDNLVVLTQDELTNRDRTTEKRGYDKGAEASIEMFVKKNKQEMGLEFEGKDPVKFLDMFKSKVLTEAKIEPSAALQEKENIINGLRTNLQKLEQEKNDILGNVQRIKIESTVAKAIPSNLAAGIEPDEVLITMRSKGYDFQEKDGAIVAVKNGEVVADTALRPLPVKDVINSYVTERGWLSDGDGGGREGRGGGHSKAKTGIPTKLSEAEAQWKAQGKNTGTADYDSYIADLSKENPQFDLMS